MLETTNDLKTTETGAPSNEAPELARRLGLFDATMIVMGGIVGAGIFINPYVVAQRVHTPTLVLGAWATGGLIALVGAFIWAELAALKPKVGGQYAYMREAFHPSIAFIYGWTLLLVTQTGGMAAVAVTFAKYFVALTHAPLSDWTVAAVALAALTLINCLGVRAGGTVQNALMVMKIVAIAALVGCGLLLISGRWPAATGQVIEIDEAWRASSPEGGWRLFTAFGATMVPVLFAYGGWQTANFIAGEVRNPRRNLPLGLLIGVVGVIVLYLAVNVVYVGVLGVDGLATTKTPASEVMRLAMGEKGKTLIAIGIAVSTLGFLSQSMLTAPRVYFAMADDGLFFKSVARLDPRTRVPVVAIALQGVLAIVIALSGTYEQILNYVVAVDSIFFAITAAALLVFHSRAKLAGASAALPFRLWSKRTMIVVFIIVESFVAINTAYNYPANSAIGLAILVSGIPVYFFWRARQPR
ncbi:MAG TPA: amino acid permease [Blastocatellia bacterium]|nr:amino acid permease [Blastocatellia bacterium]